MEKEPYEKPELMTIDLGNLIDEAEKEAAGLTQELRQLRNQVEDALGELAYITGELATVHVRLQAIQHKHLVAQTVIELQHKKGGRYAKAGDAGSEDQPPEPA